jgi:hypothetical protein
LHARPDLFLLLLLPLQLLALAFLAGLLLALSRAHGMLLG